MKPLLTVAILLVVFAVFFPGLVKSQSCDHWLYTPSQPSYMRIGDLDIPGNKVTVEAVFTRTAPYSGVDLFQGDLVSKHLDPKDVNYLLRPSSAEITTTNGYFKTPTICPIELNKTYHAALVYDGTTLKFYRNGFLMSQIAATGNLLQNDWQTQIGLYFDQKTQEQFAGYINEVRIWNVARTQSEIKAYMNRPLPNPQSTQGLLAYYTFDNLLNKQGNTKWNGTLGGSAAVNQKNAYCAFVADSCNIIPVPPTYVKAGFTTPDTICVNSPVTITNTSTGASNYYWNFCVADLNSAPTTVNMGNTGGILSKPVFIDYVLYNNNYYGFLINYNPGALIRLDFGNSLLNTPTVTNLGNFGGILPSGDGTEGIQVIQNEGKWYAIIVGGYFPIAGTPRIVKIDFGPDLANKNPTATNWGNLGNMQQPIDLHVFKEGNNWYGLTVNAENNTITRFNFTNSFSNTPTADNLGNIGNLAYPTGIYAIDDDGFWRVFIVNGGNNTTTSGSFSLTRLDFGSSLLNTPTGVNLGSLGNKLQHPRDLTIMKSCNQIVGFVVNGNPNYNDIVKIDFHNNLSSVPTATSLGNIGNLSFPHSISKLFREGSDIYGFVTNVNNNTITRLKFNGCNNSSMPGSALQNPSPVTYNTPGTYRINLSVDDGLPTQSTFCKSIVVMPQLQHQPTQSFSICSGDSVLLSSNNQARNKWNTGSTANAIYAHTPGTYWVQSTNGACTNIDSFIVATNAAPFSVNLGKDTAICKGDSVVLDATNTGAAYVWQNGQATQKFTASTPGTYSVAVSKNGCTALDTIIIRQLSAPVVAISNDTTICPEGKVGLHASGGQKYVWTPAAGLTQNNIANPIAAPSANTTYTVAITGSNGCIQYDSVSVSIKPKPTFNIQPVRSAICLGDTITLQASGGDIYAWSPDVNVVSPAEAITKAFPAVTTRYKVMVKDAVCQVEDSLFTTITVKRTPVVKAAKSNDLDCSNGQAQLIATGAENYKWLPAKNLSNSAIQNPVATPVQTTTFYVQGTVAGCSSTDSITVNVLHTGINNFYLPNAFTPNNDNKNDCFSARSWGYTTAFSMNIYNRWGEKVFSSNNTTGCWDGTYKGIQQPAGVYIYIISAKTLCGDVVKKGTVTLIR